MKTLSEKEQFIFFGYHDKIPTSLNDHKILANRVYSKGSFEDIEKRELEIGFYKKNEFGDIHDEFIKLDETETWSWQQGCMLQWDPRDLNNQIVYNSIKDGKYQANVLNIENLSGQTYEIPIYSLDPTGRYASSLNFSRLEDLRPGYGYHNIKDPFRDQNAPEEDGLFIIDRDTGDIILLVSLKELSKYSEIGNRHYINHATFSPAGDKLAFFHIMEPEDGNRTIHFYMVQIETGELELMAAHQSVSHYCWNGNDHIITTEVHRDGNVYLYRYSLNSGEKTRLTLDNIGDTHPMAHPKYNELIIADTKPDLDRNQHLFIINLKTGKTLYLDKFYSPKSFSGRVRCDLHPRWNRSGDSVIIDTITDDQRSMTVIDCREILKSESIQ